MITWDGNTPIELKQIQTLEQSVPLVLRRGDRDAEGAKWKYGIGPNMVFKEAVFSLFLSWLNTSFWRQVLSRFSRQ